MSRVVLFPMISAEKSEGVVIENHKDYSSVVFGENIPLIEKVIDGTSLYFLEDEAEEWTNETHGFIVKGRIRLNQLDWIKGENGYAPSDSSVGVALEWMSQSSRQRGSVRLSIEETENELIGEYTLEFQAGQLRGDLLFRLILYIAERGNPKNNEVHLANVAGMIIGELDAWLVMLDGIGSMFPIFISSDAKQPLWWVECNIQDNPFQELFIDCVKIYLNKSHKDFKCVDDKSDHFNGLFLKQVIASAMVELIVNLRDGDILKNTDSEYAEPGSLMAAVKRFIDLFQWETEDISRIHSSIMTFFDKEWKL